MKGIILAGGHGTRLYPMTVGVSKQLLPVYDKPMIYYSLSMLLLAGIRDILLVSTPEALPIFRRLLGDGSQWGVRFSYVEQDQPRGIAEVFLLGEEFIGDDRVMVVLGDNIFFGHGLPEDLEAAAQLTHGACVFAYPVKDPERYGVVVFNDQGNALQIVEKPKTFISRFAVPGIYIYDNQVVDITKKLKPSARGELEITDVNLAYLQRGQLSVRKLGRGVAWLDAGTPESLLQASSFIQALQERQGLRVACLEEIAYRRGYIDREQLRKIVPAIPNNEYYEYLLELLEDELP
jgi:glucose-1-phosphate thymidylyltransferase